MIQTHQQLLQSALDYNSLFSKNEFYPIQKAYSTPHFLVLIVRFAGTTKALYIGRGNQYQGFFVSEKLPPSFLRTQDRLLDYVRKYLVGARIGKLVVATDSMSFYFAFKNESADNQFHWGYQERKLFFANILKGEGKVPEKADRPHQSAEAKCNIDYYLQGQEQKARGANVVKKLEKFLTRKKKNIEQDLHNASLWRQIQQDIESDNLDLNANELKAHEQKFKFQKQHSVWDRKNIVYEKIKRLKIAEALLTKRLREVEEEIVKVGAGNFEFTPTKEKTLSPIWQNSENKAIKDTGKFKIINFKINQVHGVIGLDAQSNDWIRHEASKDHWWFHVENHTGAHCIVKTDDFGLFKLEDLSAIASMLRDYSKLSIVEIPVMYTQVKNLKGVKGSAGKVIAKKPKYLRCVYGEWNARITILS